MLASMNEIDISTIKVCFWRIQVTQRQQQQRLMQQQQEVNGPSVKVNPPIVKPIPSNTRVNGTCQEV